MAKQLLIKLQRSPLGCLPAHRKTVQGLGLTKLGQTRWIHDSAASRGMLQQVSYLVAVLKEGRQEKSV